MLKEPLWLRSRSRAAVQLFTLAIMICFARSVSAQQAATTTTPPSSAAPVADAETMKALLQRVQDLESQVQTLKFQIQALTPTTAATNESPAAPPLPAAAPVNASLTGHASMPISVDADPASPRLQLSGFGDVDWKASDLRGQTNSFALGQFNLFITSRINNKISFLAETVIEADSGTNEFGIEPERLLLLYSVSDRLNLQIGRYHTGLGFYNTAYHHSAVMQTTLGRPFLFQFEDNGGILPVHNVGVSATGLVSSRLGLHYIAEVGNGRSARTAISNPVQNVEDENNGKAFNLGFYVHPPAITGLRFGLSAYHDHLTPLASANVSENIFAGHIVYQTSRFEFLNEAVLLEHSPDNSNITINIPGFYSQISRRFGAYRPYFRYEYVNVPASDPLYSDVGLLHGPRAGLRYELAESAAFKVEVGRDMRRNLSPVNLIGTQLSFAF